MIYILLFIVDCTRARAKIKNIKIVRLYIYLINDEEEIIKKKKIFFSHGLLIIFICIVILFDVCIFQSFIIINHFLVEIFIEKDMLL